MCGGGKRHHEYVRTGALPLEREEGLYRHATLDEKKKRPVSRSSIRALRTMSARPQVGRGTSRASSPSNTLYFWNGRLLISKDAPWAIGITGTLLIAGPACWIAFEAPYLSQGVSVAPVVLFAYFWINSVASMLKTALTLSLIHI